MSEKLILSLVLTSLVWFCSGSLARAEVRMGVELQAEYNDNLFLEDYDETEDIIYRVAPWIGLTKEWPRLLAALRYQPRFNWYEKNPENDLTGHNVDLDVSGRVSPLFSMGLMSRFIRGEERNMDGFNAQQSPRLPYESYASTLSGDWFTGREDPFGLSVSGETRDYDKDSLSQDIIEWGGRVFGRKGVGDGDAVTLDAEYIEGEYDDSTSYQLSLGTVGSEHALNSKKRLFLRLGFSNTTGNARVNYTSLNPLVGVVGELKNMQYDIGVGALIYDQEGADTTYDPSFVANVIGTKSWRRGEMTAAFSSGYEEDYIDSGNPGFDTYASTTISGRYGMAKNWTCIGSVELRVDSYQDNRPGGSDRNDATVRLASGLEHQLMRRATLRLDYMFNARRSEIARYEYEENSILVTLNIFTD